MAGIDWDVPNTFCEDSMVDVEAPPTLLCNEDYQELSQTINPLGHDSHVWHRTLH